MALVLTKDSIIQWETLVLSDEMCFTSKYEFVGDSKQIIVKTFRDIFEEIDNNQAKFNDAYTIKKRTTTKNE